jgi:uncharacterized protein (TIGR02594 family)
MTGTTKIKVKTTGEGTVRRLATALANFRGPVIKRGAIKPLGMLRRDALRAVRASIRPAAQMFARHVGGTAVIAAEGIRTFVTIVQTSFRVINTFARSLVTLAARVIPMLARAGALAGPIGIIAGTIGAAYVVKAILIPLGKLIISLQALRYSFIAATESAKRSMKVGAFTFRANPGATWQRTYDKVHKDFIALEIAAGGNADDVMNATLSALSKFRSQDDDDEQYARFRRWGITLDRLKGVGDRALPMTLLKGFVREREEIEAAMDKLPMLSRDRRLLSRWRQKLGEDTSEMFNASFSQMAMSFTSADIAKIERNAADTERLGRVTNEKQIGIDFDIARASLLDAGLKIKRGIAGDIMPVINITMERLRERLYQVNAEGVSWGEALRAFGRAALGHVWQTILESVKQIDAESIKEFVRGIVDVSSSATRVAGWMARVGAVIWSVYSTLSPIYTTLATFMGEGEAQAGAGMAVAVAPMVNVFMRGFKYLMENIPTWADDFTEFMSDYVFRPVQRLWTGVLDLLQRGMRYGIDFIKQIFGDFTGGTDTGWRATQAGAVGGVGGRGGGSAPRGAIEEKLGNLTTEQAVDELLKMEGLHERRDREVIKEYLRSGGVNTLDPATTAWCAGIVNAAIQRAGTPGNRSLVARDFIRFGTAVAAGDVKKGDILVEHRNKMFGTGGHVGLATGRVAASGEIEMIAGNTSDMIKRRWYSPGQLIIRRPPGRKLTGPQQSTVIDLEKKGAAAYRESAEQALMAGLKGAKLLSSADRARLREALSGVA